MKLNQPYLCKINFVSYIKIYLDQIQEAQEEMKESGMAVGKVANDYMCIYEKFVAGPSRGRKGGTYGHKRFMLQLKKDRKRDGKCIPI